MTDTLQPTSRRTPAAGVASGRVPMVATRLPLRKRLFDLSITLPLAIVTLPVVLVLGAISFVHFRRFPVFSQPRLGQGGRVFTFWKIRTLPRNVPDTADKYQLRHLALPKFARVLRRHHLDELPQLWHVVSGKMSLVGPRPEMPTLSASFDPDFVAERLSVHPGVTGLWQISTSSRWLIGETPELDLHYVRNWTLRLDLWIALRTPSAMTANHGIESLGEIPRWTGARVST